MIKKISGKAFVFGKNIDTDQIYPGRYLALTEAEEIGRHAMEGADAEFANKAQQGDIIVAGPNFGCGSSREHAVITIKNAGVGAVLAESFGRIFYRNGINLGLPLLVVPGITDLVRAGDVLSLEFEKNIVMNQTSGKEIEVEPISEYMFNILDSGGIKNLIRKQYSA